MRSTVWIAAAITVTAAVAVLGGGDWFWPTLTVVWAWLWHWQATTLARYRAAVEDNQARAKRYGPGAQPNQTGPRDWSPTEDNW